ncbi:MAG TPA: poly-gamma-glutamate hydrolase family protein [Myxococcota bacterium]|nr:poly-gamma-glutamate hydrolase family protein [Myxococcota bacterium]
MPSLIDNIRFGILGARKYRNFADLAGYQREGADYRILTETRPQSNTAVIAPHGGKIEIRTSEIARAIAGSEMNLYVLEGIRPSRNFKFLRLTSDRFDDPRCLDIMSRSERVVSIHGCAGAYPLVLLGGLDSNLLSQIETALRQADLPVRRAPPRLAGTSPKNICNRGLTQMGVQLEISRALRGSRLESTLVSSIRKVLMNCPQ